MPRSIFGLILFSLAQTIVFGIGAMICGARGHKWSQTWEFKNHRERVCDRCQRVEHWTV